jgi:steroid delta-isomerase-like uncharacterized protein
MTTTTQRNKDTVRKYIQDAWNEAALDLVEELVTADAPYHEPVLSEAPDGPDARKRSIRVYHSAFPDAHISIEEMVAEDGLVAVRWTGRGTHEGELMDVEPTGTEVEVARMSINRVRDGEIVETWEVYDALGMLRQVGAVPDSR